MVFPAIANSKQQVIMLKYLSVCLLIAIISCQLSMMNVDLSSYTVSATTDYTFTIQKSDYVDLPALTSIEISFPSQYASAMTTGSLTCVVVDWPISSVSLTCSMTGLTLTVTGGIPTFHADNGLEIYAFMVSGITNPPYSQYTDVFDGAFVSGGTTLFSMQSNSGSGVLITEGIMACSMTSSPTTVNTRSIVTLTVDPVNTLPIDGKIVISSVNYWTRDVSNSSKIFNSSVTLQCNSITNTASNINCAVVQTVDLQTTVAITVTNIVSSSTSSLLSFSLSPVLNPPTVQPQGSFTVSTRSNSNGKIDACTNVKMTGVTAGSLTSQNFLMNSTTVNSRGQATIQFKLSTSIVATDTITITFPSGFILSVTNVTLTVGNRQILNPVVNGQVLSFAAGTSATQGTVMGVLVTTVINPPEAIAQTAFAISTLRNNYLIDTLSDTLSYTATASTLTGTLSSSSSQLGAPATYTLTLTLTNPITSTGYLVITFPLSFSLAAGSYTCTSTQSVTVSCSYLNYLMTVTSIATAGMAAGGSVILTLSNIVNPMSLGLTSSLIVRTYYRTGGGSVDVVATGLSLTLVTRNLQSTDVTLSCSSDMVYTLASFTFTIANKNTISSNSYIYIAIPPEISLGSYTCTYGSTSVACDNRTINSIPCIRVSLSNSASISPSSLSPLTIHNLYTPTSTAQTSTFQLYISFSDGTISQQLTNNLFFTVTSPSTFQSLTVTSNNTQNYADTLFTITLSTPFTIPNNARLTVSFPMTVSGVTCTASSALLSLSSCVGSGAVVSVGLGFSGDTNSVTVGLAGIRNYPNVQQYTVSVGLYYSTFSICYDTYPLMNTVPNTITINSYSFSNTILKNSSDLSVQFAPTIPLSSTDYILIIFPSQFTVSSLTCTVSTQFSCLPSSQTIKITSSSAFPSSLAVAFGGLVNPSSSPSSSIYIETYTQAGYLKDRDYSLKFVTTCQLYCRTCQTTNTSYCLSCYSDASIVGGNTVLSGGVCTSTCTAGYYLNVATGNCMQCSGNCSECSDYSVCTKCPTGYFLVNTVCLGSCTTGYYGDVSTQTCQTCTSALHCTTCTTATACSSCDIGYNYYSGLCLTDCPALITTLDYVNRVCQSCPTNCSQCTSPTGSLVVTCTKCNVGYLLDQDRCFLTCQTPGFVPTTNGLQCAACSPICLTCSGNQLSCLSCNTSSPYPYLFNTNCLSSCSGGYYSDSTSFTCKTCTSPCQTCQNSSVSSCLSCITNYYLYNRVCVGSCPSTFYADGSVCTACQGLCVTCTAATICTSCQATYYLYNGGCVVACPTGMIQEAGVCTGCSPSCRTCEGATNMCTGCYSTTYLLNGTCYVACPNGYYAGTANCEVCVSPCLYCSSSTACTSCLSGFNIDGSSCLVTCTGNRIAISGVCQNCDSQCLTCVGTTSTCTSCQTGLYYTSSANSCTSTCPTGLFKLSSNCTSSCPNGYYPSLPDCIACPSTCTTCTSTTSCSACATSTYFYNNMCYLACPADAPYPSGSTCVTCPVSNCATCSGTLCVSCQSGYLLVDRTSCITSCPTDYTYNAISLKCQTNATNNTDNTTNSTTNSTTTTSSIRLSFVPLPYFTVGVIFICVVVLSKCQHPEGKFVACALPIISLLAFCTCLTNLILTITSGTSFSTSTYLQLGALGITLLLNLSNLILVCVHLPKDPGFSQFFSSHHFGVTLTFFLSLLTTFKLVMFLYSHFFSFGVCSLSLATNNYHQKLTILLWVSVIAGGCYIGAGAIEALKYNYDQYLFYGGIQLVLLGVIEVGLSVAGTRGRGPGEEGKYKETQSITAGVEHQHLEAESHNQIQEQKDELYSEHNQIKQLNHQGQSEHNQTLGIQIPNQSTLNIFDLSHPDLQDTKKRAQSAKSHQKQLTNLDDAEYQSALVFPKDSVKVQSKDIAKALNDGLFRENAKSILEKQRIKEDESALADAVKLYYRTMAKEKNAQQHQEEGEQQGGQEHNEIVEDAQGQQTKPKDTLIYQKQQENEPTNLQQKKGLPVSASYTTPQPKNLQQINKNIIQPESKQKQTQVLQEEEEPGFPSLEKQEDEVPHIIFDDQQDALSAPTHISKEPSMKPQTKRLNSLGKLQLIMEQEDLGPPIEQITLDQNPGVNRNIPLIVDEQKLGQVDLKIKTLDDVNELLPEQYQEQSIDLKEPKVKKQNLSDKPMNRPKMLKGGSVKQVRQPSILIEHDLRSQQEDLQSIFTVEDKDYVEVNRSIDLMPIDKRYDNNRYIDDGQQDLVKPSELFKKHKGKVPKRTESMTIVPRGTDTYPRPPLPRPKKQ